MPKVGEAYEMYIHGEHFWKNETRLVLEVSPRGVLFKKVLESSDGTVVEPTPFKDVEFSNHKQWKIWEQDARLVVDND